MIVLIISLQAGDRGYIDWHYPVTASLFDFTVEAPVEGLRALPLTPATEAEGKLGCRDLGM